MEQIIAVRTRAGSVMPKSVGGAARSGGSSWRRGTRAGEVEVAGPVPESGPGEPLALNRVMRARLYAAVRCLLADKSLEGVPDSARLAAVVLLAKAPARSAVLRLRAGEMARWLGVSTSSVNHAVLPAMREAGAAETEPLVNEAGRVTGLEWKLLPLAAARESGDPMHPLALARKDLATLLRFCEALFAPGWAPVGGPVTPPGLLAARRGRGAATDRLALLLLALQTRPDGRVRLVGGSVKEGRGRADATVARALGCSVSGGGKVLDRLERERVVGVGRATTGTGQFGKGRLLIPAVAVAFGRGTAAVQDAVVEEAVGELEGPGSCSSCAGGSADTETAGGGGVVLSGEGWQQESFDDVEPESVQRPGAASGDHGAGRDAAGPVTCGEDASVSALEPGVVERPAAADLHAVHAPVVSVLGSLALSFGSSGEAAGGSCRQPEPAGVREDTPGSTGVPDLPAGRGAGGPLRGEQRNSSPKILSRNGSRPVGAAVFVRPAPLPAGLETVLAPVASVWERIARSAARRHVAAAVRTQLARLRGIVGPQHAEQVLADRLERRLCQQTGRISDPAGWLLGRGLVQRAWCWSQLCDEGSRMDSGAGCPSCQTLIGDQRGLRARVRNEVARELPGAAPQVLRAEFDKRLQAAVAYEAAVQEVRRERAVAERAARAEVFERRRAGQEAAEQSRRAQPCADCGIPDAGGLCLVCTGRRSVERTLAEAVDLAVMGRADLTDPAAVVALTGLCAGDTRALLEQYLDRHRAGTGEEPGLFAVREIAEAIRDQRRERLYGQLLHSSEARAEADAAYESELRARRHANRALAEEAADRAAHDALLRAAEFLFADRARRLAAARAGEAVRPVAGGWAQRLAELADRQDESSSVPAGMPQRKAVSVA
ncbi:hypothetical protein [Streptomyces sp. CAU 1734]|uniref:hypothetical protein n=1 Tax=Streptomyces sp. CAU 1734 TaxID=3140360 RepID=UPI003261B3D8